MINNGNLNPSLKTHWIIHRIMWFSALAGFMWANKMWLVTKRIHWNLVIHQISIHISTHPIGRGCRIYWLHLCREVRPHSECLGYDTKLSNGEAPVLELWVMWSAPSFSLLSCPFRLRVVAPVWVLSMGQRTI